MAATSWFSAPARMVCGGRPAISSADRASSVALALALPLYPRAPGAELGQAVFAEPGTAPLKDEDLRPFAGLAGLKAKLEGGGGA